MPTINTKTGWVEVTRSPMPGQYLLHAWDRDSEISLVFTGGQFLALAETIAELVTQDRSQASSQPKEKADGP